MASYPAESYLFLPSMETSFPLHLLPSLPTANDSCSYALKVEQTKAKIIYPMRGGQHQMASEKAGVGRREGKQ